MTQEREYVVSLNAGVDYDQFWHEMETNYPNPGAVPDRAVDIVNERPGSTRSCHYALTDQEAAQLRADPRVKCVEIPPDQRTDIQIRPRAIQSANFTKPSNSTGNNINWGLVRCINTTNPYGTDATTAAAYNYCLDGFGVDVVIQDSGIQVDHPEFLSADNMNRVQQIDWYTESGLPGTQSANFYRDFDGHGTHVAAIAAGLNYGWAKGAEIYSMKVAGLEGSGDSGTGISVSDCFDAIKLWHQNKPVLSNGYKRPTVVNMSWGYSTTFSNITGGSYRGTPWTGTTRRTDLGMIGSQFNGDYWFDVRVGSVDTDVEEMIAAGIIVVMAAGNSYQKIDVSGGLDYNNYFTSSVNGNVYYHRGGSPYSDNGIKVGSLDSVVYDAFTEQKSVFSNGGPGVDVYAPGSDIRSACSTTNAYSAVNYFGNSSYRQVNLSGTSMAAPQVAGMAALFLQMNKHATPAQVQDWIIAQQLADVYTTGLDDDYTDSRSVWGGASALAYNNVNSSRSLELSNVSLSGVLYSVG